MAKYDIRLRKLEDKAHAKGAMPVMILEVAEDGSYIHSNGAPVTKEELQRTEVLIIDNIPRQE